MDTPMSHSDYEELAAGYVLGALEPDDEHAFQQHLGGCSVCEANVRELEAVVKRAMVRRRTGWVTLEDFSTALPLAERTRDNLAYVRTLAGDNAG